MNFNNVMRVMLSRNKLQITEVIIIKQIIQQHLWVITTYMKLTKY